MNKDELKSLLERDPKLNVPVIGRLMSFMSYRASTLIIGHRVANIAAIIHSESLLSGLSSAVTSYFLWDRKLLMLIGLSAVTAVTYSFYKKQVDALEEAHLKHLSLTHDKHTKFKDKVLDILAEIADAPVRGRRTLKQRENLKLISMMEEAIVDLIEVNPNVHKLQVSNLCKKVLKITDFDKLKVDHFRNAFENRLDVSLKDKRHSYTKVYIQELMQKDTVSLLDWPHYIAYRVAQATSPLFLFCFAAMEHLPVILNDLGLSVLSEKLTVLSPRALYEMAGQSSVKRVMATVGAYMPENIQNWNFYNNHFANYSWRLGAPSMVIHGVADLFAQRQMIEIKSLKAKHVQYCGDDESKAKKALSIISDAVDQSISSKYDTKSIGAETLLKLVVNIETALPDFKSLQYQKSGIGEIEKKLGNVIISNIKEVALGFELTVPTVQEFQTALA